MDKITLGSGELVTDVTVRMPRAFAMPVLVDGRASGITVHVSTSAVDAKRPSDEQLISAAAQIGAAVKFAAGLQE